MSEGVIIAIGTAVASIISYFVVRWMNGVDKTIQQIQDKMTELEKHVNEKLATVDDLKEYAVHKNTCNHVHQEMNKSIMRERYRVNELHQRLADLHPQSKTPRKTFPPLEGEPDSDNSPE